MPARKPPIEEWTLEMALDEAFKEVPKDWIEKQERKHGSDTARARFEKLVKEWAANARWDPDIQKATFEIRQLDEDLAQLSQPPPVHNFGVLISPRMLREKTWGGPSGWVERAVNQRLVWLKRIHKRIELEIEVVEKVSHSLLLQDDEVLTRSKRKSDTGTTKYASLLVFCRKMSQFRLKNAAMWRLAHTLRLRGHENISAFSSWWGHHKNETVQDVRDCKHHQLSGETMQMNIGFGMAPVFPGRFDVSTK